MTLLQRHLSSSSNATTRLNKTLVLDSTSYLSGILVDQAHPRFSLNTSVGTAGPVTTISSHSPPTTDSQPLESIVSNEVGVVEWKATAIGRPRTVVKTKGQLHNLSALMKTTSFGSMRDFGLAEMDVRWIERDGTWQCTSVSHTGRILAVLHSRIATRGTRIEISNHGHDHVDNIVLTALFVLHGEQDWKAFLNKPTITHSPYSFYHARNQTYVSPSPHVTALTLTLSSVSFLDGLLAVGGQLMYAMRTTRNKTVISKYTWEETPRMEEFATIEWLGNGIFGKSKSMITYKGKRQCLDDFLFSSFLGNRMRRFGMTDFLPWMQWVERPPSWQCYSHPGKLPLAILDRRFLSAGTKLEVTMEGLQYLDPLVVTAILVVVGPWDWKRERPAQPGSSRSNRANAVARVLGDAGMAGSSSGGQRPTAGRSVSAASVLEHPSLTNDDSASISGPPGLTDGPTLRHAASEQRLSRISGESDIPEYSPPPRGLVVYYGDDHHYYSRFTQDVSALPSRSASPLPGQMSQATLLQMHINISRAQLNIPSTSRPQTAFVEDQPPPDYHP